MILPPSIYNNKIMMMMILMMTEKMMMVVMIEIYISQYIIYSRPSPSVSSSVRKVPTLAPHLSRIAF
jgi:hypothetical protein